MNRRGLWGAFATRCRAGYRGTSPQPFNQDAEFLATTDFDAQEARYDVAKLLRKLPDRQRLPILYVKIEGATVADAAKRTGMSESAIKVGIHRGLKALAAVVGGLA